MSIDFKKLSDKVMEWTAMRFYPSEVAGRLAIVKAVGSMAGTPDRAFWIVDQMLALTNDWPGILEVRGVFCTMFKPADGVEAQAALCPEGFISREHAVGIAAKKIDARQIEAPQRPMEIEDIADPAVKALILSAVKGKRI